MHCLYWFCFFLVGAGILPGAMNAVLLFSGFGKPKIKIYCTTL